MPTPAKLVAALAMALVGLLSARAVAEFTMADWMAKQQLPLLATTLGALLGWRVLGRTATGSRRRGDRLMAGMMSGVGAAFLLVLAIIVIHAAASPLTDASRLVAREPMQVVERAFGVALDDVVLLMEPRVLTTIFGGGAIAGLAAGIAGRIWW